MGSGRIHGTSGHVLRWGRGVGMDPFCAALGVKNEHFPRWGCGGIRATSGHVLRWGRGVGMDPFCAALGVKIGHVPRGGMGMSSGGRAPPIIRPAAPRLESLGDLPSSNRRSPARFGGSAGPR
ncbi:hypothetical protein NicSoilC12_06080 [Arthrobacter sp. NicSoilC12]|nr:hypothetical protein NicSoilC12_06080 [Arthrobacter sp. NicSoilC12]